MDLILAIALMVVFALVGAGGGYFYRKNMAEKRIGRTEEYAKKLLDDATRKAAETKKEMEIEAKEEVLRLKTKLDDEIRTLIVNDRKQLFGSFCRACGYCMPCPAGIEINTCARMSLLLRRSPSHLQLTPEVQAKMMKIKDCLHCGHCMSKCPYGLNTPELLQRNLKDYEEVLAGKEILPGNF